MTSDERGLGNQAVLRAARGKVSQPGEPAERLAEAMAGRALLAPAPATAKSRARGAQAVPGLGAPELGAPGLGAPLLGAPELGAGRSLEAAERDDFEPRFGADLSQVRVHDDGTAHSAASGFQARAFSFGQNIVFGSGEFAPRTAAGRALLAHELAHTIQARNGLAPVGVYRMPVPGMNFTPADYAKLTANKGDLTMAVDSAWFPTKLQQNLLNTLKLVLGPSSAPPATEGVNAVDFFHGHLTVKKDPATATQVAAESTKADKYIADFRKDRAGALGPIKRSKTGEPLNPLTTQNIPTYKQAVEKNEPALATLMNETALIPGAALVYHTFEFNNPADLAAKGQKLNPESARRQYVTPLDTNSPQGYSSPTGNYQNEYTVLAGFCFLIDAAGAVHVRPFDAGGPGFTTLELSTITGTPYKEPLHAEY